MAIMEVNDAGLLERIHIDPRIMDGMPCIRGTRIPVRVILDYLAEGEMPDRILTQYPQLTMEDLRAAIAFGAYAVARWYSSGIDVHGTR